MEVVSLFVDLWMEGFDWVGDRVFLSVSGVECVLDGKVEEV